MANIEVNGRYPINLQHSSFGVFTYGTMIVHSSSKIVLAYGSRQYIELTGSNLEYNDQGGVKSGTFTSYANIDHDFKYYSVSDVHVSAAELLSVAATHDRFDDFKLIAAVFSGKDTFSGGESDDSYSTYAGDDILSGNEGNDHLDAGKGNDRISGGFGNDHLTGGAGNDVFIYKAETDSDPHSGIDTITDFGHGDKIDLHSIDANATLPKHQAFTWIGQDNFTKGATSELRYEYHNSQTWIVGITDDKPGVDFAIKLDHHIALNAGDFFL
jgi:Ca2+-binding RTX toxin-like protein